MVRKSAGGGLETVELLGQFTLFETVTSKWLVKGWIFRNNLQGTFKTWSPGWLVTWWVVTYVLVIATSMKIESGIQSPF